MAELVARRLLAVLVVVVNFGGMQTWEVEPAAVEQADKDYSGMVVVCLVPSI